MVVETAEGAYVCEALADSFGDWSCSGAAPGGSQDFRAYAVTNGFGGGSLDGYSDGTSGYSNSVSAEITPTQHVQITTPGAGSEIVWTTDPIHIWGVSGLSAPVDVVIDDEPSPACTELDVGEGWTCAVHLEPGYHDLVAMQAGSLEFALTFAVLTPAPTVYSADPLVAYLGIDSSVNFWGETSFPGGTVEVAVLGEGWSPSCEDSEPDEGGYWDCDISLDGATVGDYPVMVSTVVGSAPRETTWTTLSIVEPDPESLPTITCEFSPGSARIIPAPGVMASVWNVNPGTGGGITGPGRCNGETGTVLEDVGYWDESAIQYCDGECLLTDLEPGVYNVYYSFSDGEGEGEGEGGYYEDEGGYYFGSFDYFFTIPDVPTFDTVGSAGGLGFASGAEAVPGNTVVLSRTDGTPLCSAIASEAGTWACSFTLSSADSGRVHQVDAASGGMSGYSSTRALPAATTPAPPADLGTRVLVIEWLLDLPGNLALKPGDTLTITSRGLPIGTAVVFTIYSTPVQLLSTIVDADTTTFTVTIPTDLDEGPHTLEAVATTPDGQVITRVSPVMVAVDPAPAAPSSEQEPQEDSEADGGSGSGGSSGPRSDPAAPSALSDSLPTVQDILANPIVLPIAAGLALALLLLVAVPTELLNATLSSNTTRLGRGFAAIERRLDAVSEWFIGITRSRALAAAIIVVLVSITFGFIDPEFGFDAVSVRMVLSLAIAFFLLSYGVSWLGRLIVKRTWAADAVIVIQPSIILFAVIGVVVARLIDFSPGFLVGVVIGLELVRASRKASVVAVLVQFGLVLALSVGAWVAYSLIGGSAGSDDFLGALLNDTLVAITAEGLMGALVALLPLQFLDGRELFNASKRLWFGSFFAVALAFSLLVLPTASGETEVSDVGVWIAVFTAFAIVTITIWYLFARAAGRADAAEERERESEGARGA